jgi:hypothetical protein
MPVLEDKCAFEIAPVSDCPCLLEGFGNLPHLLCPEVEFINDNFRKISRLLLTAIHKFVFPLDFTLAIDFSSPGSRPWISFVIESKITCFPPLVIGGKLA